MVDIGRLIQYIENSFSVACFALASLFNRIFLIFIIFIINPRHACTARVTVVCVSVGTRYSGSMHD